MKNIAFNALRYGIIAIVSTLLFYVATIIVDSLGHILQIDSVIKYVISLYLLMFKGDILYI